MALFRALIGIAIIFLCGPAGAISEKRVALVIGNSAYENAGALANPLRDAKAVAQALRETGFDVTEGYDLNKTKFDAALKRFGDAAKGADWALVYFAGHGIGLGGESFLLPVDVVLEQPDHVDDEAVSLSRVRAKASGAKALRLIVLDSCRNNPFAARMAAAGSKRAVSRGLSRPPEPEGGELIAYATRENDVADDGTGTHSPFTAAFLQHLSEPGLEVNFLFRRIRANVLKATKGGQDPAIYASLSDTQLFFVAPAGAASSAPDAEAEAARDWAAVDKNSAAMLKTFLSRHGRSRFAAYAQAQLDALTQTAEIVPPKKSAPLQQDEACDDGLLVSVAAGKKPCIKPGSGESFKDCPECPEMVVVPAGSFSMGSPASEPERYDAEGPQHTVAIPKPFAVGRFAVTFAEWDACAEDGGCGGNKPSDNGWGRGDRPVINVNWNEAKDYIDWLSKKTGKTYRLLSEAEREYAARAGTSTPFWWGRSITPALANYNGSAEPYKGGGSKGEYRQKTLPVKSFKPNAWGLYQVHGNVWEWVEDCWNENYHNAPSDGSANTTGECGRRVVRGGSWSGDPLSLRAAFRDWYSSDNRDDLIGFRVGRMLKP
jgi:formylglycine-generating enzyme required for sulfatase activity